MSDMLSPLACVPATRAVLQRHGLATKKALGQHFLVSDGVVRRICSLADVREQDCVLEVGPGIGTLTIALLKEAGQVISIERDADLPDVLAQTCAPWAETFCLICRDALEVGPDDLPFAPNKMVSNLPYAVAATLVLDYFQRFGSIRTATVMVQAEVADRMGAKAGSKDYGAYTVKLSLLARVVGRFKVPAGNFFPPPRVESAVVRLDRVDAGLDPALLRAVSTMADAAFATRRKTVWNSCRTYFSRTEGAEEPLREALSQAGIDPRRRGETLSVDEFKALGAAAHRLGLC